MSTLKDALCLLAIFVVYGVAGHMDYEDAVAAQEVQQASLPPDHLECPTAVSAVGPERPPRRRWPDSSSAWQSPSHERCPHDSGGERARH